MKSSDNVEKLIKKANAVPGDKMNRRTLNDIFEAQEESKRTSSASFEPKIWKMILLSRTSRLAATFLIISSLVACFVLSGRITDLKKELEMARQDIPPARHDDTTTINLYLKEHQDVVAQHASVNPAAQQPAQMRVNQHDIMYYEILDDEPEYMQPGIIVRGPSSQREINSSEVPLISNGHALTLSEARETADFELQAPAWLDPGFALNKIRSIEGRDAMQLLYTNGIDSVSLFEQPLDGQRGLSRQDFREYAVYSNVEQVGGTILAWRDDVCSYVLIGNTELSQLMNMAQSISAGK